MAPSIRHTPVPGLLVLDLAVHGDARGWFKENWQRAKMTALGLPDFGPVQHSVAHNGPAGVTRGVHAEPWDKLVSIVHGRAFGAWVDLREGPTFGTVHTEELDEHTAVFVPRGVGNSYQTLVPDTVYSYLVNAHWSADADYTMLNLADETVAIPWPVPLTSAEVSAKDRAHPRLRQVTPQAPSGLPQEAPSARPQGRTVVLGAGGQLARALAAHLPDARLVPQAELDLTDHAAIEAFDFSAVDTVINAAAFTQVDRAETADGRRQAWAANATGLALLAAAAARHDCTLVHYSSDYVFDGTAEQATEGEPLAPLGVYGQSKAAGDLAVSVLPRHYLLRTAWMVGDGDNFVRTMRRLAARGIEPRVVDDQVGRLTFADELARATIHLLASHAAYGTYHVTNGGEPGSWAQIARRVFAHEGRPDTAVHAVSTQEYAESAGAIAPRPARSVLDLTRLRQAGFEPRDQWAALEDYLRTTD
ncbi:bifunctional dTDP-4-dehydrorhamnose 3,5-epimerase family protein/NAD(P)-dependent oxidoreductase [Ornithinimicrobium sp. F0845]|uniref:sugar nucleotide-binding protein n=1 Tax=Ornithinimicrobium sp. F0845 TaxID=2926412 RepID=UPI001FF30A72|nr:bifunctional dTDP-4-dehydrorhamnose 3,5-epimerase family protein/NAD(P)-dependent oxidoreductase [Ornithinimicrobium sp. F0845]